MDVCHCQPHMTHSFGQHLEEKDVILMIIVIIEAPPCAKYVIINCVNAEGWILYKLTIICIYIYIYIYIVITTACLHLPVIY